MMLKATHFLDKQGKADSPKGSTAMRCNPLKQQERGCSGRSVNPGYAQNASQAWSCDSQDLSRATGRLTL